MCQKWIEYNKIVDTILSINNYQFISTRTESKHVTVIASNPNVTLKASYELIDCVHLYIAKNKHIYVIDCMLIDWMLQAVRNEEVLCTVTSTHYWLV